MSEYIADNFSHVAFESILENLPGHVYWHDTAGVMLGCNNAQARNLGYSSWKEIAGKSLYELHAKEEAENFIKNNNFIIESGQELIAEEFFTTKDNKEMIVLSHKMPLYQNRKIVGVLGISTDITDRKIRERLEHEKALTSKVFAASIAHELRTPLGTISSITNMMTQLLPVIINNCKLAIANGLGHQCTEKNMEFIRHSPQKLSKILQSANTFIDMMLMKVNIENVKASDFKVLSMVDCVNAALSNYPFADNDRALVDFNASNDFSFEGDEILFRHVIFNLLKNALYYVKTSNKPKANIQIWLEKGNDHNTLHFKDTGIGMNQEVLNHVFDQFYSKTKGGTGVGLALCKLIIEEFGGKIRCDSRVGEYVHFRIEL